MLLDITSAPYHISIDGTHDATDALEKALEDIKNSGGGTIQFPENAFICISRTLSLPDNVVMTTERGKARIKYYHSQNIETKHLFFGNAVQNVTFSNIIFDTQHQSPSVGAIVITSYGKVPMENSNILVDNCEFKGMNKSGCCAIRIQKTKGVTIQNCTFEDSYIGIGLWKRNSEIEVKNNSFSDSMTNTAIRFTGNMDKKNPEFCDKVRIENNSIRIKAVASVIKPDGKPKGRPDSFSGIYLTCGDKDYTGNSNFHDSVQLMNNTIIGPKLGFFSGGSADLFSIKDTKNFVCKNNIATGSGDLGFAFERCHQGEISNNTAEENNSCGISVLGSSYLSLTHNKCGSNEQTRDRIYQNHPYGGIRIEYGSHHITIENNEFYQVPTEAQLTQHYGIVIKSTYKKGIKEYPSAIKVVNNTSSGQVFGAVFNESDDTEIL